MRVLKAAVAITFAVLFSTACATSGEPGIKNTTPAAGTPATSAPSANTNSQPPVPPAPGNAAPAAETPQVVNAETVKLYTSKCAMCHGSTGKGATPGTPDLTSAAKQNQKSVGDFADTIKQGKKPAMPAFGNQLNDAQIKSLAQYVHDLAKN